MELRIATPCPKSWDDLAGDDRVRFCRQCNLNVYNLAQIPRAEVEELIRKREGRFCGRLYVQPDRKASTRDCPTGRDRLVMRRVAKLIAVLLVSVFGWLWRGQTEPVPDDLPEWTQRLVKPATPPPVVEEYELGEIDFPTFQPTYCSRPLSRPGAGAPGTTQK
jgi:hypothetical protein